MPSSETPSLREEEPDRERVGAGHRQAQAAPPVDLGPRPKEHLQTLSRLLATGEDDAVLTLAGRSRLGHEHAVREHVVVTGEPAVLRDTRTLGDGDPVVDPIHQEAPDRRSEPQPAELTRGVEGRDERCPRHDEDGSADRGCHRLVQVEDVEALPRERAVEPARSSSARGRCWAASRSPER